MIKKNRFIIFYILLVILCIGIYLFTCNNHSFYKKDLAKVVDIEERYDTTREASFGYKDKYYIQTITLEILNNEYQGEKIVVENEYDDGLAFYEKYEKNEVLFVDLNYTSSKKLQGTIEGIKRDKYFVLITIIFILTIILVGKLKGLLAILGLIINLIVFVIAVNLNTTGTGLVIALSISSIIFTVTGLLLASGLNKCTLASIISSILGLLITLGIALLVFYFSKGEGIRFDQMELLTRPYKSIFICELMIGGLGAIMDISITITSAFKELINKNNKITSKDLIKSGIEIGKDVTGTMINVLFFTYICGVLPTLVILFRNGIPIYELRTQYISLELVRALTGAIGITLTIPIAIATSIFILRRKQK